MNWKSVIFFGAHTDDEMACAGTLHRLAGAGARVYVVTFSPAATENDRTGTHASMDVVTPEWSESMGVIGVALGDRHFLGWCPSASLPARRQEMCQCVYDWCERVRPDAAFILSPHDENTAHSALGEECERVMRGRVGAVLRCQFPWNYCEFRPNYYVEMTDEDEAAKRRVIRCYQSQRFRYDYEDMLLGYARADGLSVKATSAEKFEVVRWVNRAGGPAAKAGG